MVFFLLLIASPVAMTTKKVGGEYITIALKGYIQKWTVEFVFFFSAFQHMHLVSDNVVQCSLFFSFPRGTESG